MAEEEARPSLTPVGIVLLQRVADANGVLAPAHRALRFGQGVTITPHPDDSLSGTSGGDGEVTGYLQIDFPAGIGAILPCRVAITSNQTSLATVAVSQNGVSLQVGDRALLTGQTAASENGIYVVTLVASGHAQLARTADTLNSGALVTISSEDTANPSSTWVLIATPPIVVGTTALVFVLVQPEMNVRRFGAIGNGTANDTVAIATGVAALAAIGGGELFFPPGVYLTDAITISTANVALRGLGASVSKIKMRTSATNFITIAASQCAIEDLTVDGATLPTGLVRINGAYVHNLIDRCILKGAAVLVDVQTGGIDVVQSWVDTATTACVRVTGTADMMRLIAVRNLSGSLAVPFFKQVTPGATTKKRIVIDQCDYAASTGNAVELVCNQAVSIRASNFNRNVLIAPDATYGTKIVASSETSFTSSFGYVDGSGNLSTSSSFAAGSNLSSKDDDFA